jgi:hypothetical protein
MNVPEARNILVGDSELCAVESRHGVLEESVVQRMRRVLINRVPRFPRTQ